MALSGPPAPIRFGAFELDATTGELRKAGITVKLHPQPFRVLVLLTQHPGEMVTREQIREQLWGHNTFVDFERGINFCINQVRSSLGDNPEKPRYVETLARRGYRFIAPVETIAISNISAELNATSAPAANAAVAAAPARKTRERIFRKLGFTVAVLLILLGSTYFVRRHSRPRAQPPTRRIMLAVLPFQNLTGDPNQDYFSDGLTEEMITTLGGLHPERLGVIARTSVMQYKHGDKSVGQIGSELGVQYLLEGSVRRDAGQVRITAQLVQVKDQTHLWAASYQRDLRDVLGVQNDVAEAVAGQIQLRLTVPEKARLALQRPISPEAHEAYLKGRFFWNQRTAEGMSKSAQYFQQAIDDDSKYALAYAGLAEAYVLLGGFSLPKNQAMPKARAAAKKALELDDSLAEAHNALALIAENNDWDWQEADREYREAIRLNPNYATAHHWYGEGYLAVLGRFDEAKQEMKKAKEMDPLSLSISADTAAVFYFAREYGQAIDQLRRTLAIDPNFAPAHYWLGMVYEQTRDFDKAIEEWQWASRLDGTPRVRYGLGRAYGLAGKRKEALQILAEFQAESKQTYVAPWCFSQVYLGLGDKDQAFAWLDKAYEEKSADLIALKIGPAYDPLRSDPRFTDLIRRIGLPP